MYLSNVSGNIGNGTIWSNYVRRPGNSTPSFIPLTLHLQEYAGQTTSSDRILKYGYNHNSRFLLKRYHTDAKTPGPGQLSDPIHFRMGSVAAVRSLDGETPSLRVVGLTSFPSLLIFDIALGVEHFVQPVDPPPHSQYR